MEHETEKRQMDERNKDHVGEHEQQCLHVICGLQYAENDCIFVCLCFQPTGLQA